MTPISTCWLALGLLLSGLGYASADSHSDNDRLAIHGFGTLGLARSDNDTLQYVRDLSQPEGLTQDWSAKVDSVLGIQASYRITDDLDGVVQAISRYRHDGSHSPEISWAFLRYDPSPELSLRAGRLGTEFFMLADSRLVGYSNLTVRPPPDYYDSLVMSYLDGFDVTATLPVSENLLRGKLFIGRAAEDTPFIQPLEWRLGGSLMLGGHVDYLTGPWQWRLGHARIRFDHELPFDAFVESAYGLPNFIDAVPDMSVRDRWAAYTSLGAVYEEGPLQVQLMLNQIDHDSAAYENSRAGYAIASYRIGKFSPYLGYSRVKSAAARIRADPSSPYTAIAIGLSSYTHSDQNTTFLGLRWDVRPGIALKMQVDRIDADPSSIFPYREGVLNLWEGRMNVYSLALDFTF